MNPNAKNEMEDEQTKVAAPVPCPVQNGHKGRRTRSFSSWATAPTAGTPGKARTCVPASCPGGVPAGSGSVSAQTSIRVNQVSSLGRRIFPMTNPSSISSRSMAATQSFLSPGKERDLCCPTAAGGSSSRELRVAAEQEKAFQQRNRT